MPETQTDVCPSCKTPLKFTADTDEGDEIQCDACGADLVVTFDQRQNLDVRLAAEVDD